MTKKDFLRRIYGCKNPSYVFRSAELSAANILWPFQNTKTIMEQALL